MNFHNSIHLNKMLSLPGKYFASVCGTKMALASNGQLLGIHLSLYFDSSCTNQKRMLATAMTFNCAKVTPFHYCPMLILWVTSQKRMLITAMTFNNLCQKHSFLLERQYLAYALYIKSLTGQTNCKSMCDIYH